MKAMRISRPIRGGRRARLAMMLCVLLSGIHCTDQIELLFPSPATSTSASSSSASTGVGGAGGNGGGSLVGAGGSCELASIGATCSASADCCSGLCALDPEGHVTCRPTTGCLGLGQPCEFASACCSLSCEEEGNELGVRRCAEGPLCAAAGAPCQVGRDCCGGVCDGETCARVGSACHPAGETCGNDDDCCGRSCTVAPDDVKRCALVQGCRVVGEQCATGADCCSGACRTGADNVARCLPTEPCTMADGKICSAQAGDICKADDECCSRACRPSSDGPKRCSYLGGCHQQCERCMTAASCCSGRCLAESTGVTRCVDASECDKSGEVCGGAADCCPSGPGGRCDESAPMLPPKRCLGGTSGVPDGETCSLSASCEGGFCIPTTTGELACSSVCVGEGQRCTARSDCCEPLIHDCMSIGGEPRCVMLIH